MLSKLLSGLKVFVRLNVHVWILLIKVVINFVVLKISFAMFIFSFHFACFVVIILIILLIILILIRFVHILHVSDSLVILLIGVLILRIHLLSLSKVREPTNTIWIKTLYLFKILSHMLQGVLFAELYSIHALRFKCVVSLRLFTFLFVNSWVVFGWFERWTVCIYLWNCSCCL